MSRKHLMLSLGIVASLATVSTLANQVYATDTITVSNYAELYEAFDSLYGNEVPDTCTIILSNDIEQADATDRPDVAPDDEITLDLAGHTITFNNENSMGIINDGILNITGNGLITNYDTDNGSEVLSNSGTLNLISGSIISHSTSPLYHYRAAVYSNYGNLNISDGFVIKAEKDQAVGVMLVVDGTATFGNTIGPDANQVEITAGADAVVAFNDNVIFNNGKYTGGSHGVVITNSNEYNGDKDTFVNAFINYAEFASNSDYSFYAGVDHTYSKDDGSSMLYPDKRNVNLTMTNAKFITGKGLLTTEGSTHTWQFNVNKSAFTVTRISTSDDYKAYEIESKPVVTPTTSEDGTITGEYYYYGSADDPDNPSLSVWDAADSTDTYTYNDNYFAVPSPGIHADLRTMSYALALTGFENQADGYPYDDHEAPNPKLRKLLGEIGFSDYESWDDSSDVDGHSMGTSIAHKTITYTTPDGITESKELIVVVPRSYNYMTEWLSNFNVGDTGDHAGFSESADYIVSRLNQYLSDHSLSNYKIWIVGYSRGGAVVDLAGKKINQNLANYDMTADDLYAYTFGAPRASDTENNYSNIHDVKDGNDLLLGYIFPTEWGFYNTGTYEEIHPADLEIVTHAIDITDITDPSRIINLFIDSSGLIADVEVRNAKEFVDEWFAFITANGLTRAYFNSTVKDPLSKLMQAYQNRTVDKQSEFSGFLSDMQNGLLAIVLKNLLADLGSGQYPGETLEEILSNFPPYLDLVKILRGTATEDDIAELATFLKSYIGSYSEYGDSCAVTEEEFLVIKDALPELIEAIGPLLTADAKFTLEHKGESYSLYFITTIISDISQLVYGHLPEDIMPLLKSYTDPEEEDDDDIIVPNTGANTNNDQSANANEFIAPIVAITIISLALVIVIKKAPSRYA